LKGVLKRECKLSLKNQSLKKTRSIEEDTQSINFKTSNTALEKNKSEEILRTRALKKQYDLGEYKVNALLGVDFIVHKGEFVTLMGPSGSGKSTLLHLLGGLDKASNGEVILANHKLSNLNDKQATLVRRNNIGFVFQFFNLLPTLTAIENIALPFLIDGQNINKYQNRINAMLNLVGLADRANHKPDQLSGGEQQRVAIARAMVTEPAIVLADEPTGNLDSKTGKTIMDLLRKSCDEFGQTIVVVTHDPRAAAYADRIVFLHDGEIINEIKLDRAQNDNQRVKLVIEAMEEIEF
jgi:putative ABC transport system ATP-binding protein